MVSATELSSATILKFEPTSGKPPPALSNGEVTDTWQLMEWMRAYSRIPLKLWPYKVGIRLALYRNRQTGQIDPTYDTIAADLGTSRPTIERAMKVIKSLGVMKITNTGRGLKITLIMPPVVHHHIDVSDALGDTSTVDVSEPEPDTSKRPPRYIKTPPSDTSIR